MKLRRLGNGEWMTIGISSAFVVMGLLTLAMGDASIGPTRYIRVPVDIVGTDRTVIGLTFLSLGYFFLRWLYRDVTRERRLFIEGHVIAVFIAAGYAAYRIGTA